jgi:hypothetical protein
MNNIKKHPRYQIVHAEAVHKGKPVFLDSTYQHGILVSRYVRPNGDILETASREDI